MKLKKIIYVTRITLPRIAHTIQIIRSAVALANQDVAVDLFVRRNNFANNKELSEYFGVQIPRTLRIKTLPPLLRQSRISIAIFIALKSFFEKGRSVFYVRDFRIAKEIIKLKWLHRLPIFVESHDRVSFFQKESTGIEKKSTAWRRIRDYVFGNSDGMLLISKDTMEFVNNNYRKTPAIFAWHGTEPIGNFNYSFSPRNGIYYTGNISSQPIYRTETLLEAMKYIETEKLILIGGYKEEDISRVKHQVKNLGVLERVEFKSYVPPGEIKNYLKSAKVVVSLLWGLKLSDYLSLGVPIIVPDLPLVREVLQDGKDCAMFQYNNPESLASAINKVLANPTFAETLARNAYETAQEYTWQKRAEKILNFIEDII